MDTNTIVFLFRGIERLTIVFGAIVCVVMGIRLYGGKVTFGGKSDLEAEGAGLKIKLSNAGPGAILALFGMVVLGVALRSPAEASQAPSSATTTYAPGDEKKPQQAHNAVVEGGAGGAGGAQGHEERQPRPVVEGGNKGLTITYGKLEDAAAAHVRSLAHVDLTNARDQLIWFKAQAQSLLGTKNRKHAKLLSDLVNTSDTGTDDEVRPRLLALKERANLL